MGFSGADWFTGEPHALNSAAVRSVVAPPVVSGHGFILRTYSYQEITTGSIHAAGHETVGAFEPGLDSHLMCRSVSVCRQ